MAGTAGLDAGMRATLGAAEALRLRVPWGEVAALSWRTSRFATATDSATSSAPRAEANASAAEPLEPEARILALHGWLDNSHSWAPLVRHLPPGCRLVAVDLPGHGLSSHKPPGSAYAILDWLRDVHAIADALQWSTFHLLGHSLGASISGLFAGAFPQRVCSLSLVEGVVPLQGEEKHAAENIAKATTSWGALAEKMAAGGGHRCMPPAAALERLRKGNADLTEESARLLLARGTAPCAADSDGDDGQVYFTRDLALLQPSPYRLTGAQVDSFVRRVACPTLVVVGDKGLKFQSARAKRQMEIMAASAPSFEVHLVPGNHHVHMNQPERVAEFLRPFLAAQRTRPAPSDDTILQHLEKVGMVDDAPSRTDLMDLSRKGIPAKL